MNYITEISTQQAYEAYRKLKNYFYYDNTSLFIRQQIAEFESDFHPSNHEVNVVDLFRSKVQDVLDILNNTNDDLLDSYLAKIKFRYITKSVEDPTSNDDEPPFIINRPLNEDITVEKLNMIIDAPIEIHIISVLWLMVVGVHFSKAISKENYAYQFMLNEEENIRQTGLQIYRPYYIGYQEWRDSALSTALRILDEKKDATLLSLDIKRYFYSVRVNLNSLLIGIKKSRGLDVDLESPIIKRLCDVLQKINRKYTEIIIPFVDKEIDVEGLNDSPHISLLPVGLLSSGFIGNLILCDFDEKVIENMNPAYYGRYVDDMLFVCSDRKIHKKDSLKSFIQENLIDKGLLKKSGDDYAIVNHETLKIQLGKIVIEHFYHKESRAAINKFKNNINKQRSEFRYLPDEEVIDKDFDNEAFVLQYSESINKLRSIKEYKEDKYGASKFLAHKIFLACLLNHTGSAKERKAQAKSNRQILTFFKGRTCISFSTLWEKVATYFIINNDEKSLNKFIEQVQNAIDKINSGSLGDDRLQRFKRDLSDLLLLSVAYPYALNLKFGVKAFGDRNELCRSAAVDIRYANMFRHQIVGILGINYTTSLYKDEVNLYQYSAEIGDFDEEYALCLSPRFVHYDEINIVALNRALSKGGLQDSEEDLETQVSRQAEDFYHKVNYSWISLYSSRADIYQPLYETSNLEDNNDKLKYVRIIESEDAKTCNKRIGIVNMKVPSSYISDSMWNNPVLTTERRNQLFQIINMAIKEKCELLVLPELSVPFQWLEMLIGQCKRHNLAIITGLEYYHSKDDYAYNCVATILPIKTKYFTTAKAFLRVKNYYAPKEKKELAGRRKQIPEKIKRYHLFHWRKCYFSVYNCFELANISDRALFKSKVDFIVATEWNPDVNYYADIAGSWVRDVHCYFIQCNTSSYGDSCIMQPSKTENSRMVTVKGGANSTVLVEDLKIDKLREFQYKEHILQMDDNSFKLTPPDFSIEDVKKRMLNEKMVKHAGES